MHFPKYWARGVWRGMDTQGDACTREASGWSDVSVDEARTRAEEKAHIRTEAEKIKLLEDSQRPHPEWAFRVYRTAAGLRYLLVSTLCHPEEARFDDACAAVGVDPNYRHLCQLQKSFHARLSPKPWRGGLSNPPHRFPFSDAKQAAAMDAWQAKYQQQSQHYAVCSYLLTVGAAAPIATAQPILAEHDRLTRAESSLPLA